MRHYRRSERGHGYCQSQYTSLWSDDIEVLRYPVYTKETLDEKVSFVGREHLDALKESGDGAIIMASHAGNWELLGAVLAMNGYPLISVAQEQDSHSADKFINEYRAMMKQHVTYKRAFAIW